MDNFEWAHEGEEIDWSVVIDWSLPVTHDMLNSGLSDSNDSAYFYAIIGLVDKEWWPYYIGKVYFQTVMERHKNSDHINRLKELKRNYPNVVWHITLGTPTVEGGMITSGLIDDVEGLLIYSSWHEENINKSKINDFNANRHIQITNTGFIEPFPKIIGYGVFVGG